MRVGGAMRARARAAADIWCHIEKPCMRLTIAVGEEHVVPLLFMLRKGQALLERAGNPGGGRGCGKRM